MTGTALGDASRVPGPRRVLALALPIMLSNASVPLVGLVDTAVSGRLGSPDHLSAVAVAAVLFSSIYWVFGFLRMGTGGLIAQAFGAADLEAVRRTTWQALTIAFAIGAAIVLLQRPLLALGLGLMDDHGDWSSLTATYFGIRVLSAPATLGLYALLGALVGCQRMRSVLALQLVLNLANVALTILLFRHTDLGIAGIALATLASEWLAFGLGLWLLRDVLFRPRRGPLVVPPWLYERESLARFLRIGTDLFVRTLCLTAAFYWLTVMGSRQGVAVLAANAVLLQLLHLMAHCLDGFAHAAETLTGFAIGQRDRRALDGAVRNATALALPVAIAFALLYGLAGAPMIDLLTTEPEVRALARQWLPWIVAAPLVGVWSFLLDGIFIGATRTREMRDGMLVSLAVFVPASIALTGVFGNHGLWMAYHLLLVARAATLVIRYPRVRDTAVTPCPPGRGPGAID